MSHATHHQRTGTGKDMQAPGGDKWVPGGDRREGKRTGDDTREPTGSQAPTPAKVPERAPTGHHRRWTLN